MLPIFLTFSFFFFPHTSTTEIYTLSLHDALPIYDPEIVGGLPKFTLQGFSAFGRHTSTPQFQTPRTWDFKGSLSYLFGRSEEHTSELQSLRHLVCRLLLEKKKKKQTN